MIGNDIVDLKQSPPNWKRPRFLEKVFTKKEHALIFSSALSADRSENQHKMMWSLWSMKEAAYKCHVQQFGERFFNPKRLECELISGLSVGKVEAEGIVRIDNEVYYTNSTITEDYVYTIANLSKQNAVNSSVFKIENPSHSTQSSMLKQYFIKSVSESRQIEPDALKIEKTAIGVPQLFNTSEQLDMQFSLTHCGRFSGFAY